MPPGVPTLAAWRAELLDLAARRRGRDDESERCKLAGVAARDVARNAAVKAHVTPIKKKLIAQAHAARAKTPPTDDAHDIAERATGPPRSRRKKHGYVEEHHPQTLRKNAILVADYLDEAQARDGILWCEGARRRARTARASGRCAGERASENARVVPRRESGDDNLW